MNKKKIYLVDATAFCYRAFYALKGLFTSFGQPTNAIYGFVNMLNKILKNEKPQFFGVCFDVSRKTFRQEKFAEYKLQRPPMPDELSSQIPFIKRIVSNYGIRIIEKEGYEADDIIATLVKKAKDKNFFVTIISSDKDILQLVDENTVVFSPYKEAGILYDRKKISERFGVEPERIVDIIALMGDDVDNIPGVSGIGEKTAVELIRTFGSLKDLLSNIDKIKKERIKEAIKNSIEKIRLNQQLVTLKDDLQIDLEPEDLKISKADYQELFKIFNYLEFKTLLKNLPLQEEKKENQPLVLSLEEEFIKKILKSTNELFLYGFSTKELIFYTEDRFFQIKDNPNYLKEILTNPQIKKIGHDLKRMMVSLAKEGIDLKGLYFDTMIAGYLLNPSKNDYSLNTLAWDYLGKTGMGSLNNKTAIELILELKPILEKELKQKALFKLFMDLEMPLVEVLAEMELTGISLDTQMLKELSQKIEKKLIKLIDEIYILSGCQFNLNSPKQLREILFERLKLPIVKKSKTGPSTDEEVLKSLSAYHRLPQLLLEYRQLTKLKTTYVDVLPNLIDPYTNRVHTFFNQTGTETGRLSSSNPNLQNIPIKTEIGRNIRRAIVCFNQDSFLLSCDYSQIELRILAHLCHDENLLSTFRQDKDIHRITASLIYGLDEEDIDDSMREIAKRVNFGIIYGLTAYGLSRDLGISVEQAQGFIDAYFVRYPKVKEYIDEQIIKAQKNGFVSTILGRRRYISEINSKNQSIRQFAQRQAVNAPVQGSASDLIKLAMIQIHREIKKRNLKTKMILQIHDELLFDVPDNEMDLFVSLVKDKMENVLKLDVPIKVQVKKGKNWLDMEVIK
ncbi:MAG: DNA polymerase I [Candidatus Omnitrophica bacterium]|nr:DNA polymerase I [Candidatus Omnitrophota bacterium]